MAKIADALGALRSSLFKQASRSRPASIPKLQAELHATAMQMDADVAEWERLHLPTARIRSSEDAAFLKDPLAVYFPDEPEPK